MRANGSMDAPLHTHYDAALQEAKELEAQKGDIDARLAELQRIVQAYEVVAQHTV